MFEPPGEGCVQLATPGRRQLADDRLADQVMGDSMRQGVPNHQARPLQFRDCTFRSRFVPAQHRGAFGDGKWTGRDGKEREHSTRVTAEAREIHSLVAAGKHANPERRAFRSGPELRGSFGARIRGDLSDELYRVFAFERTKLNTCHSLGAELLDQGVPENNRFVRRPTGRDHDKFCLLSYNSTYEVSAQSH